MFFGDESFRYLAAQMRTARNTRCRVHFIPEVSCKALKRGLESLTRCDGWQLLSQTFEVQQCHAEGGHLNIALNDKTSDEFVKLGQILLLVTLWCFPPVDGFSCRIGPSWCKWWREKRRVGITNANNRAGLVRDVI